MFNSIQSESCTQPGFSTVHENSSASALLLEDADFKGDIGQVFGVTNSNSDSYFSFRKFCNEGLGKTNGSFSNSESQAWFRNYGFAVVGVTQRGTSRSIWMSILFGAGVTSCKWQRL